MDCNIGNISELESEDVANGDEDAVSYISDENIKIEEHQIIDESIAVLLDNFEGESETKHLICKKFGFDEKVYKRVLDNGFDIEGLLVATESEINELFPIPLLGIRAKFKFHLNLWRKNSVKNVSNACRDWIEAISPHNSLNSPNSNISFISPPLSCASLVDEPMTSNITLTDLLKQTEKGQSVLDHYKTKNVLDERMRQRLICIIVDSYTFNKKKMSMRDIEIAANAIHRRFPSENKEYYLHKRGRGLNPTGKLHDKAVNARLKVKGKGR